VIGSVETIGAIASKVHIHRSKLCDWNAIELGNCDGSLPHGLRLKIPQGACTTKTGQWACYEVKSGDTLSSIATSRYSLYRNEQKLRDYNTDTLWGQEVLHPGMHLRLPVPRCVPELCANSICKRICYTVQKNETIQHVAKKYGMTAAEITDINSEVLGGIPTLLFGMHILVHHPYPLPPDTDPAKWPVMVRRFWTPYVVMPGDTLWNIAQAKNTDPNLLCQLNKIDCSHFSTVQIQAASVLIIPVTTCTPIAGQHVCVKNPSDNGTRAALRAPSMLAGPDNEMPVRGSGNVLLFPGTASFLVDPNPMPAIGPWVTDLPASEDWTHNPYMVQFAKDFYNLNAHLIPMFQRVCTVPGMGQKDWCLSPSGTPLPLQAWALIDTSTYAAVFNMTLEWSAGMRVLQGQEFAVPYIPCVPNLEGICLEMPAQNPVLMNWPRSDNSTPTQYGWNAGGQGPGPIGAPGRLPILGFDNLTNAIVYGTAPGIAIRMPILLPNRQGSVDWPPVVDSEPVKLPADRPVAPYLPNKCIDVPGPGGHHCYKLTAKCYSTSSACYNESLSTVAREIGVTWQSLCTMYQLKDCNYIQFEGGLEVPNSADNASVW
jgi:LysM repeat protein